MPKSDDGQRFSYSKAARSLQENVSRSGTAAAVSYTLIGAIILLGGLGYGFDAWRGTSPWGVFVGLMLGIIVGFYELIKTTWRQ
jgi:F0F1-type ATP synthase assembly protein I